MQINDGMRIGGVFDISLVRGVQGTLSRDRHAALLGEGGSEALIEYYLKKMGGSEIDRFLAPNRFVNEGLALIVNFLKGTGGTVAPTKIVLGSGATSTAYVSGDRSLVVPKTIPAAYSTNGLAESTVDSPTPTIGTTTSTGDKLTFIKDFTAAADVLTGSAPDEVLIRNTTPKALCYAPFPAGERTLASGDHLIVTYNLTLVP